MLATRMSSIDEAGRGIREDINRLFEHATPVDLDDISP
jgi:hypothetical protein